MQIQIRQNIFMYKNSFCRFRHTQFDSLYFTLMQILLEEDLLVLNTVTFKTELSTKGLPIYFLNSGVQHLIMNFCFNH